MKKYFFKQYLIWNMNICLILICIFLIQGCNSEINSSELDTSEKEFIIKVNNEEQAELTELYKSIKDKYSNDESAFMNEYYIGMNMDECYKISKYLVWKKILNINSTISEKETAYGNDYEKIPFDLNCDRVGCLTYKLDNIEIEFNLKFRFIDTRNASLLSEIRCEFKKLNANDFKYLTHLYEKKFGKVVEVITYNSFETAQIFKNKNHSIKLVYNTGVKNGSIQYRSDVFDKQVVDKIFEKINEEKKASEKKIRDVKDELSNEREKENLKKL